MDITIWIWIIMFGGLVLRVPIMASIGFATLIAMIATNTPLEFLPAAIYQGTDLYPFLAIPCFILAGALMDRGGITEDIVNVMFELVGRLKGGLGITTVLACAFFAAISGSGPATAAAIGALMIPSMAKRGYSTEYAAALSATGGTLGILIPPSNPMIIYGVIANVSIGALFMAGFLPGFLVTAGYGFTCWYIAQTDERAKAQEPFSLRRLLSKIRQGIWSLLSPVVILGGIYGGIFTPVEAAVIAVVYAFFVGLVIKRNLGFKELVQSLYASNLVAGAVMTLVGVSMLFSRFLTMFKVPDQIGAFMMTFSSNWFVVLLLILVLLLFLGCFADTSATIIILTPIFVPILTKVGVDLVHFGIIFVVTCEMAYLTPPYGVNLFVVSSMTRLGIEKVALAALPYMLILLVLMVIISYFPGISLFLPRLVGLMN
jgi:C4-dicarboxylate transporter, DctM subunit